MTIVLNLDKNKEGAMAISEKAVAVVQHDSGPESVNYLTKLCNHCNIRLELGYDGKDLCEDA